MWRNTFLLTILVISAYGIPPALQFYRDTAQKRLNQILNSPNVDSFSEYYAELWIVIQTKGQYDVDEICQHLRNVEAELSFTKAQYYLQIVSLIEGCEPADDLMDQINKFQLEEFEEFKEYYPKAIIAIHKNEAKQLCSKIPQFIGKDGAGKIKKLKQDDNYKVASQLYHIAELCLNVPDFPADQLIEEINIPIQQALINLIEIYRDGRFFIERESSIISTARFLDVYLNLLDKLKLKDQVKEEFQDFIFEQSIANGMKDQLSINLPALDRYWVLKLLTNPKLVQLPIPQLNQNMYFPSKAVQFQAKFTNLLGEKINPPEQMTVQLFKKNKIVEGDLKFSLSVNKTKEYQGYFEVQNEKLRTLGEFRMNLMIGGKHFNYQIHQKVYTGTRVKISDLNFALVEGKGDKPQFEHQVDENELYPELFQVNENFFMHVIFKLTFEKGVTIIPTQVALRLVHPSETLATYLVQVQYEPKKQMYYGIIDFGDPEHILPFNGLYGVEIIIGDQRLIENKRWKFGQVNVTFSIPDNGNVPHDGEYKQPGLIQHHFQPPFEQAPFLFVSFFLLVTVFALLFLIRIYKNLNVNLNKFPKSSTEQLLVVSFLVILVQYFNILKQLLLMSIFALLVFFWVFLNLIQTIVVLGFLSVPLFLIGNYALLSLKPKQKED